ncbi:hypothetical protein [Caballeronia sp. EK]|nr:hypothetical protein [Caballeronia sp. EK]
MTVLDEPVALQRSAKDIPNCPWAVMARIVARRDEAEGGSEVIDV